MRREGRVAAAGRAAAAAAAAAAAWWAAAALAVAGCGAREAVGPSSSSSSPATATAASASSPIGPLAAVPKRCGALEGLRALGTGVEVAVGEVAGGAAVAALSPAGGAAAAALELGEHDDEGGDEHGHPIEPPAKTATPATGAPVPLLVKTQILLGMPAPGERLPRALSAVAETSLPPRALSVQRHPVGAALAWIEPPGLMLLRAGGDGLPVGEPRLIARGITRYALAWSDARGSFALVAADADGLFGAALGPDGAARGEPERFAAGTDLDAAAGAAAGAVRPSPAALAALLPPGATPLDPPTAAAVVKGGGPPAAAAPAAAVAFAWRDARTGVLTAALASCR